jgi:hypothetical protein
MFTFGLLSQIIVYGANSFLIPTLTLHLLTYNGFDNFWVTVFFGVPSLLFIFNTPLVSLYCKVISRKGVVFFGSVGFCMSIFMIGTSPIFHLPNLTKIIFLGLCLNNFSGAMIVIPIYPEMLNSIEEKLPELKGQ